MALGGGDQLARGASSAQFRTADVSEERWKEIFGEDGYRRLNILPEEEREKVKQQAMPLVEPEKSEKPAAVKFRAVQDRIIVSRIEEEEKVGDLYLPDQGKEKPYKGIVVAVGPGKYVDGELQKPTISVGEKVVFGKFAGAEVKVGVEKYLVIREEEIFLVEEQ